MAGELDESERRVVRLAGRGIAEAMRSEDFDALRAWVSGQTAELLAAFPEPPGGVREEDVRRIVHAFATAIWSVAPLPSNGYRPRPRPAPGRNDPCPCGSGEKHKRCCGGGRSPLPRFSAEEAYAVLASEASDDELKRLVADRALTPELLAELVAALGERDPEAAALALTPWFEEPSELDERFEPVLETWLEGLAASQPASEFIETALGLDEELPEELRPAVWRAIVPPAIVTRDIELAKEMLELLHDATPNDPALAMLEVTTLLVAGDTRRAGLRAQFWLGLIRRHDLEEPLEEVVEMLERTVRDPEAAAREFREAEQPFLAELAALLAAAQRRPARPAPLLVQAGVAAFEPEPAHAAALQAWRKAWPRHDEEDAAEDDVDDSLVREAQRWLGVLRAHPEAFDSLDVLDDLASLTWAAADLDRGWDEPLMSPLAQRAQAIVRTSLAVAPGATLPWSLPENRPALRLLEHVAAWLDARERVDEGNALRTEILRLDPEDARGHRAVLVDQALRRGDDARALELAQEGDDRPQTLFGRGLALWRLGRREEAEAALRAAAASRPLVVAMLTAGREPEKPELEEGSVIVGGEDEAWLYREEMLDVWQQTPDALEFLKRQRRPALPVRRPRRPS